MRFWKSQQHYQKKFDSNTVYNQKYTKTETKFYNGKIDTRFHSNKIPKEGSACICLSVFLLNSVYKMIKTVILKCV